MRILVLNAGSSSLKFQLIDTDGDAHRRDRATGGSRAGVVERIGGEAIVTLRDADGRPSQVDGADPRPRRRRGAHHCLARERGVGRR